MPFAIQIQMQEDGCGLDVVMTKMVLNIRDGITGIKHVYRPGMPETVNRVYGLQPFGGKGFGKIFFTDPIDPMPSQLTAPLVNEEPILIRGSWFYAVFIDISIQKLNRFRLKLYEPEPIPFSQDGQ